MRSLFIYFIIGTCFLISCRPSQEEDQTVPDNIMAEEEFTRVLTDSYLAEGASGINIKNVSGEKFDSTYLFNPMKDNNVSKARFDSAMVYYTSHPKKLKLIYDKVLENISQFQAMTEMGQAMMQPQK